MQKPSTPTPNANEPTTRGPLAADQQRPRPSWLHRLLHRRVPVVLQQESAECGAACLAMILGYHGRPTQLADARELLQTGDGATALGIADAARRSGLRARGYSSQSSDLSAAELPVIVHWEFNHFLVVERCGSSFVDVVDPASGRQRLSSAEFDAGFTGVFLTFEPGAQFERNRSERSSVWVSYLRYLFGTRRTPRLLAQIVAASFLLQILGLAVPLFTKVIVDEVIPYRLDSLLPMLALGIGIWVLAQLTTSYLRATLLIYMQGKLDSQLMLGFFEHLLSLPFQFFQRRTTGDLLLRLGSNTVLREVFTSQTLSVLFDGVLVVAYLILLSVLSPVFGGLVFLLGALQVALLICTTPLLHRLMQRDLKTQAKSQSYLVEVLNGISTVKASASEGRALDRWANLFFLHLNVSIRRSHINAVIDTVLNGLRVLSPLILLLVGAHLVLNESLSLGTMLALSALAASFLTPLASLVSSARSLQLVGAHLERIRDVLETAPEKGDRRRHELTRFRGQMELIGVSFSYGETPVLQDISLRVEPGQKVAIVGPTGSGKSTLGRLLLGFYLPTDGQVLLDDQPSEELDPTSLRRHFGVVQQESFLFQGSIRENLSLNNPELSLEQIEVAARQAAIHDEIVALPMGYESILAEGGSTMSGGQRQRLCLARALAHNPAVLLLDEATSHLDGVTETLVDRNLDALSMTRILMAHRVSTIRNADRIFVLDKGRLVEDGTHGELLARGGFYAALVEEQLE